MGKRFSQGKTEIVGVVKLKALKEGIH